MFFFIYWDAWYSCLCFHNGKTTNANNESRSFSAIFSKVLGQLPPRKIAPSPNSNTNPNPDWGACFLGGNCSDTILELIDICHFINSFSMKLFVVLKKK